VLGAPIDVALHRNARRASPARVPSPVVERMSTRLEPPISSGWEAAGSVVQLDSTVQTVNQQTEAVWKAIHEARVVPVVDPDATQRVRDTLSPLHVDIVTWYDSSQMEDRLLCAKSLLHQSDLALRQAVGIHLRVLPKTARRDAAAQFALLKQSFLDRMRVGDLIFESVDEAMVCFEAELRGASKGEIAVDGSI
jgi:hypothetical protein